MCLIAAHGDRFSIPRTIAHQSLLEAPARSPSSPKEQKTQGNFKKLQACLYLKKKTGNSRNPWGCCLIFHGFFKSSSGILWNAPGFWDNFQELREKKWEKHQTHSNDTHDWPMTNSVADVVPVVPTASPGPRRSASLSPVTPRPPRAPRPGPRPVPWAPRRARARRRAAWERRPGSWPRYQLDIRYIS